MKTNAEKKSNKRKYVIFVLILIGFMAMEFPGIFLVRDKVQPFILGMPFLYGYMFICWIYMCSVMFYAFRTSWGRKSFFKGRSK